MRNHQERGLLKGTSEPQLSDIKKALYGASATHVLLDMDGTLLDKYFDDYFWGQLVPEKYAEKHRMTLAQAHAELYEKYKAQEETLNWTDVDYATLSRSTRMSRAFSGR
jgi:FMN phosphatase YigB (HAD superfamily)